MNPIRLAIVDDSTFVRKALQRLFDAEPRIRVVGVAATGLELLEHLEEWSPDVITLDLMMPKMDGLATLDAVMARRPTPVIVLSTHSEKGAPITVEALARGAVDAVDKQQVSLVDFKAMRANLVEKVLLIADADPVFATASIRPAPPDIQETAPPSPRKAAEEPSLKPRAAIDLILIGASTGGPAAIQQILEALGDAPPPTPIVIVQHMPVGFTAAFATRLNNLLPFPVKEAEHGEILKVGSVYIGRSGQHIRLHRDTGVYRVALGAYPENVQHRPSINVLFDSVAEHSARRTLALLLTGMGADGAEGMLRLHNDGAQTVAQDQASCVVYGMPKAAVLLGAAREILPLEAMGARLRLL